MLGQERLGVPPRPPEQITAGGDAVAGGGDLVGVAADVVVQLEIGMLQEKPPRRWAQLQGSAGAAGSGERWRWHGRSGDALGRSSSLRRRCEYTYPVGGGVQVLAEAAQGGRRVVEVVVQVESVFALGFFGLLGGCLEEVREPLEKPVGRVEDVVGERGGLFVGAGGVEAVGQVEDGPAVDVAAFGITRGDGEGSRWWGLVWGGQGVSGCGIRNP
ncbi:hypothetical protein [Streptomyces sp. enrichment culture]|uniref:hypothetical protein n=1 Tax=Streptomyces sp. enrichment culture TaxID=1795815 RepID=UPI003F56052B